MMQFNLEQEKPELNIFSPVFYNLVIRKKRAPGNLGRRRKTTIKTKISYLDILLYLFGPDNVAAVWQKILS
jgi:hypothetical protein